MAELKKSPSKIPRFKGSVKQLDKENIAVKSPVQRRTKKVPTVPPITIRDVKMLKPSVTQKGRKSPFINTQTNCKAIANDGHAKNMATLQDRRGISEIRKSEKNLRLTVESKGQEISILQENLEASQCSMKLKDQEMCVMSENLLSLEERLATIENENAIQAEKLEEYLNSCPVTGNKLLCSNSHDALLGNVKENSQSVEVGLLLEKLMQINLPEIE